MGPLGIDAFIYRDSLGQPRLKPLVEINPRQTLGGLALELMRFAAENTFGWFALINRAMLRKLGYRDLLEFRGALRAKSPWQVTKGAKPAIRSGTICLNDPERAQANLAVFHVGGPEHPWYWPANTYKFE
jgi:hypothetical protein